MNQNESDKLEHLPAAGESVKDLQNLISQKEGVLRAKGRLIDNMAYQIRTLSNAVIGFSDLLMIEPLSPELMEYAKEINQAGNGLSALVNEVLDWARLESGRMQITLAKCSLQDLTGEVKRVAGSICEAKGLNCSVSICASLPAFVLSDADRLQKCMMNLVVNAVKNMSEGKLSVRLGADSRGGREFICFDVTAGGVELSSEEIQRLFEPAQEEDANTEILSMLNMGLTVSAGLPLTRQLAEALGGTIGVSSKPGEGTTYSLTVPTGCSTAADSPRPEKVVCEDQPSFSEERRQTETSDSTLVLLVEDQPSNRTVISLMLESLGVQVDTAQDGVEGVEAASQKDYGLILMDLKMPRMDGYEAARAIRQAGNRAPLIALSAKVLNEGENKKIAALFHGFLSKPIDSQRLAETLYRYMPQLTSRDRLPRGAATEQASASRYEN